LSLYQWKDLVYVSQISSENGPHSNFIGKFFRSDRSEAQTFCVPFNNLTGLAVLMEIALSLLAGQNLGEIYLPRDFYFAIFRWLLSQQVSTHVTELVHTKQVK
jgi:hypothetical protein